MARELSVEMIPALTDNYIYLIHDPSDDSAAVVDPGEAAPVRAALAARGWRLTHILNTHHHGDHISGNVALSAETGALLIGPAADAHRIPGLRHGAVDGETLKLGRWTAEVIATPGHTKGHVAYYVPEAGAVFCGDTLFALGCGRLFEGTAAEMWASLVRLRALPGDTRVYCGHEYTAANAGFATTVDPDNAALAARARTVAALAAAGTPTVPSTIAAERATNPFLRADDAALQAAVGLPGADPVEVFAELRHRKDRA